MGQYVLLVIAFLALAEGRVEVGILNGSSSTLHYLNGDCTWKINASVAGIIVEQTVSTSPQRTLVGDGKANSFSLKCVAGGMEQLNAVIITHYINALPPPTNILLDDETQILSWSHSFHPNLPVDFRITHEHDISYHVTVRDAEGREREKMISHETSLNISHVLDHCRQQEFLVQTVVSSKFYSRSSSYITNFTVILDALLYDNITVKVLFDMEVGQCVSQFHIIIDGLVDISFNITSSDREAGEVTYDLSPYISPEDVCNVKGVVHGSNDIGDSTQVDLQAPGDCHSPVTDVFTSLVVSSQSTGYSSSTTTRDQPTPVPTTPTNISESLLVAPLVLAVITLVVAIPLTVVISVFISRKWKHRGKDNDVTGDVSLQTNEAYSTVTTGVPMKRNEAYESVLGTETESPNTQHTYETVH